MDSGVSEDQKLMMDTTARFIEEVCPLRMVRDNLYGDPAFSADYRRRAAELGWFSMLVPERFGGGSISGNGVADAALLAYERGRVLQPGPFVATNVVAHAVASAGSAQQQAEILPGLLSGEATAAWAPTPVGGVRVSSGGSGFELSGLATPVQDAHSASWLLLTAATEEGSLQFLVDPTDAGVSVTPLESLDITRSFSEVRLDRVHAPASSLLGAAEDASSLVERQLAIACVLTAAESVGAMQHDFDTALQYAKDRIAFGRPIGSFQAVKHLLADTSLLLEMSKAITTAAADSVGTDDGYGLEAASMAKAFVGDSGIDLAQNCFQVFGGIGFTWEHDQHLYLRRLTTDAALFGEPSWHRERLCQLSGL
jgi:alkylation response protein AidB-like acyl-CoA dehydrogenase